MKLLRRLGRVCVYVFAAFGLAIAVLLVGGSVADFRNFDRTSGGYEPPYTDFTGEPIDWNSTYTTSAGMFGDGYVIDIHINCTTGMVSPEVFNQRFDWREFSERAIVVHEPREACEQRGFDPEF